MAMNEYEQLIEDEASTRETPSLGPSTKNPYEDLLQEDSVDTERAVGLAAQSAAQVQPDRRAEVMKLAERYRLSPDTADRQYDALKKLDFAETVKPDRMVKKHPNLAEWLSDPNNMAISSDEIDKLQDLSDTVNDRGDIEKFYTSIVGVGFAKMNALAAKVPAATVDLYNQTFVNPITRSLGYGEFKPKDDLRNNAVTEYFDNAAAGYSAQVPELSDDVIKEALAGNYKKASRALAFQVAANLPQMAVTIGSTMAGSPAAGLAASGLMSGAGEYDEALDKGVNPQAAMANAVIAGSAEAAFERMGTVSILKRWEATLGKGLGKDSVAKIMRDAGKLLLISAPQEGLEETGTSIVQDVSKIATGVNPDLKLENIAMNAANSFVLGAASGAAITSPSGMAYARQRNAEMNLVNENLMFLDAIGNKVKDLKLRKRLPKAAQQMVEQLTKDGPVENVYIKPEDFKTYFQSKNLDPLEAATLFGVAQEYQEASETGADIRVPLAKFVSNLVETEHYQGLKNSVKFNPDALTYNEAQQEKEKTKADLKLIAKEAEQDEETVPTRIQQAREVKKVIKDRLLEMNNAMIGPSEADQYAVLHAQALSSLAEKSGMSPMDLLNRYGLKIQTQEGVFDVVPSQDVAMASQGQVLNQGSDDRLARARDMGFDTSTTYYHGTKSDIFAFDKRKLGTATKADSAAKAFFFTDNPKVAGLFGYIAPTAARSEYEALSDEYETRFRAGEPESSAEMRDLLGRTNAANKKTADQGIGGRLTDEEVAIYPTYLKTQNPLEVDMQGREFEDGELSGYLDKARQAGKDSVIFRNAFDTPEKKDRTSSTIVAVFEPQQIRSTNAKFDSDRAGAANILFQSSAAQAVADVYPPNMVSPLGFISPLQNAVAQMDFKEMPAKDLANRIKNLPGIKTEELELTGVLDFLATREGKVSKSEVEQYIKENSLSVNQVVLSGDFEGSSDSEDGAVETEWGEPKRDNFYDSDDINSEMEYYGSEDYWDEERVAELRAELVADYTDENGEIDEDGLSSAVESAKETKAEEYARESVESDDYSGARFTVTDEATGWTLFGSDEIGWYNSETGENFETDLEEAKVRLIGHMIRKGALQGSTADFIKPKDVKWELTTTAETPNASVVTRKANALLKAERERFIAAAREANEFMKDSENYEQEVKDDALRAAKDEVIESYKDPTNKKNKVSVDVDHDLINATLLGNDVDGYSFTIYGESVGRNRRSGEPVARPILHETKFEGVNLEAAKEAALGFLLERRIITPEGERTTLDQQNTPVGRTKFGRYVEPGGENYREILLTIPNEGQEKFYYRNHFDQPNILVHIRVTDRVDDKGRKVLVADEIQSDWHQQGRERGYKGDFTGKDSERLNDLIVEINEARSKWESEISEKTLPFRNEIQEIEKLDAPKNLAKWLQTSSGKWAWFVGEQQVSGSFPSKTDRESAEASIKLPESVQRWNRRLELLKKIDAIEGNFGSYGEVVRHLSEKGYITTEMLSEYETLNQKQDGQKNAVPDAPFKNTEAWAGLALKRLIRLAIEQGYDAVAWMPAQTHIDRWGTDNITWAKNEEGVFLVGSVEQQGGVADGTNIEELARVRGELLERRGEKVASKEDLRKVIADTLNRERNDRSLESLTETVWKEMQEKPTGAKNPRAEGMQFFYDKVVPKTAQAIIKKLDPAAKIEVAKFGIGNDLSSYEFEGPDQSVEQLRLVLDNNELTVTYRRQLESVIESVELGTPYSTAIVNEGSRGLAEMFGGKLTTPKKTVDALEIPITDAMKAKSEQGISLFQPNSADDGPRGAITIGPQKQMDIKLFAKADLSTFLHETGHFYFEIIADLAKDPRTSQRLKDDYGIIKDWLGETDESLDAKTKEMAEITAKAKREGREPNKEEKARLNLLAEPFEKWARGFELYLAKGQAPSEDLKRAFANFKVWLTRIYENLLELRVELTPEITGVMDRLLASDQEIAMALRDQRPLFENPLQAGMSEAQSEEYKKLDNDAKREANEKITQEAVQYEMQKRQAAYKAARKEVKERVEKEAGEIRVYRALSILQKGKMPDGSPLPEGTQKIKIDRDSIIALKGKEFLKTLPRPYFYSKDDGVPVEMVAEMFGFQSATEMLDAFSGMPKLDEYVEREVDREMALRFPDEIMEKFPEEAVKAAHSDSRGKVIRFELETLAKNNLPLLKDAIRRVARRVPTEAEVRGYARQLIAKKSMAEIRPDAFARAERKAAREAGVKLAQGDIYGAFEAKRKELLNYELFRAATEARETYEKAEEFFKKYKGKDEDIAKTRDTDIVNVGRAILAAHGIGRTEKTPEQYLEKMKLYAPEDYDSAVALINNSGLVPGPYKEISFDDFSNMYETVRALWALAKNARSVEIDGVRIDRDQIIDELAMRVDEVSKPGQRLGYDKAVTDWEKTKMKLLGARASLRRVESWVSAIDDGNGVFRKYIWNPIVESTARYRTAKVEVLTKYQDLLKNWAKTSDVSQAPIKAEFYTFAGKVELMGAILHTGNKSNLEKLLVGRGWGTRLEDGTLDTNRWDAFMVKMYRDGVITKADMDFAQSVWDLMETLKPGAQKAHKAMYGFYFNEVTADAIDTPFGSYRGGYVPAITDSVMVEDNAINQEKESLKQNNASMYPTAGRGFTKSRVEQYAAPLAMDLRLVGSHIDKVLRFIHIEPSVKEVARVVMNKGFRAKLAELDPVIGQDMLVPWLQRAAQQTVSVPSKGWAGKAIDTFAKEMRKRSGLQAMFFNITNTMQQVTGFTIAAVRVKPKYLRNAMYRYLKSPKEMAEAVTSRSEFMKTRSDSQVMEVNKIIDELALQPNRFQEYRDFVQQHGYFMQSAAQGFVDHVVWSGAYEEAIANGQTEKEAGRIADSAVRETQGSMNPEDMSRFESGSPLVRMFTMFYSYFNMQANLMGTEFVKTTRDMGLRKGAGRMLYVYTMGFMLPAWISTLIVQAMGNGIDEDDDDQYLDDLLGSFFTSQFSTATAMFPIVGPIINRVALSFNSKPFDDRITLSPAISMIESAGGAPQSVYKAIADNGSKKKAVRDVMSAIGLLSGIPTGPIQRPLSYLVDVSEGEADPTGPIDFTRGLVTGKPGQVQ
jgi:hypothetical protein